MTQPTLTEDAVRTAMNIVLREAREAGRRPTVSAVERRLGVKHATFYRNFPHLIDWFKQELHDQAPATEPDREPRKTPNEIITDLRRENTQLRRTVAVYAEALRQLTLDYEESRSQAHQKAGVTTLASRRTRRPTTT
ncbi:hypothetical protein [Streptomyces sp. NRRL WC-3742]|uniref:hypothetical protein n=1 Tax=Streptomyces sp. NRRL WC-3742 TaxID=1463934 RepID=UPI000D140E32|nr:hypothetical protein [Streptomyces sp. NRRL WC-3742]